MAGQWLKASMMEKKELEKLSDFKWLIPRKADMRVPAILYLSEKLLDRALLDNAPEQAVNVAGLRGIVGYSLAMPDMHWGYGAPIGGVGAFDSESGVIVPGFVGYDINCGVRLLRSGFNAQDIKERLGDLISGLFRNIPSGMGSVGKIKLQKKELEDVAVGGAEWAVKKGFGTEGDLENTEGGGRIGHADAQALSKRALERGLKQLGTLGSGNHFLEIQEVSEIYDKKTADIFGLHEGQLTVMVHTGSRGLGYQVCDDYLDRFGRVALKYNLKIPDRQLACAPCSSPEGRGYFSAMNCAANYAFANRQIITHWIRETFAGVLDIKQEGLKISTLYDVAHNICKLETHSFKGRQGKYYVHRKGATRAFAAGHPELPSRYAQTGQPVIIPGTMGTSSYVLTGTSTAMEETWGSTCHGAGRAMSRRQALKESRNRSIAGELMDRGILAMGASRKGLAEEMPDAYKDVDEVIAAAEGAGISRKVARLVPLAVMKG